VFSGSVLEWASSVNVPSGPLTVFKLTLTLDSCSSQNNPDFDLVAEARLLVRNTMILRATKCEKFSVR